jgi:hypothetical protein
MVPMPEPMIVWMVELERSPNDIEGTLTLDERSLRFAPTDSGDDRTIELTHVTKVKRVVGSPVLLIHSLEEGVKRSTAFYLSKPPPLAPAAPVPSEAPPTLLFGNRGAKPASKRKQRRANASYLASASTELGPTAKEWMLEIRAAAAAARAAGG